MTHVRSQIRAAAAPVIQAALPGHRVFRSRRFKINKGSLPLVDLHCQNENITGKVMGGTIDRKVSLYIRVSRSAAEDEIDDLLDEDATAIEIAMETTNAFDALVVGGELVQTVFSGDAQGESVAADVVLRYDMEYRTQTSDPETAKV